MNILMVTPYLGSVYGGTSKAVTELAQGFSNIGVTIDLITTNANGSGTLNLDLERWIEVSNYRVQYFECWHKNDSIISIPLLNWLSRNVCHYDIVHTNTIFAPLILLSTWICQFNKTPYLMTPHGMLDPWALSYKAWKKRSYYTLLEKPALQKASAIHVLANSEAKNVQSLGFKNAIVIPNGIHRHEFETLPDPAVFYQQFPATKNKTLILFLGRIDPKKGLDLLARAFAKIHHQFSQTHLVVAGPDSIGFLPTAKSYFTKAGCLEAVTFTGMLSGSLKYAALAAASLYVSPSYSEGFSMSVLEGMASGLPCTITTGCNFPEAAAAQIARVVNINADEIADALIECLSNPQQAKAMGDRSRQFILEQYTWDRIAAKLKEVYSSITNKQSTNIASLTRAC